MPLEAHLSKCLDRLLCDKKAAADTTVHEDCNKLRNTRQECQDFCEWVVCVSELANWQRKVPELQMSS